MAGNYLGSHSFTSNGHKIVKPVMIVVIVIKTISGVAMAVAAALDHMAIDGLMGCIAGDDTIFLAVKDKNLTMSIKAQIEKM